MGARTSIHSILWIPRMLKLRTLALGPGTKIGMLKLSPWHLALALGTGPWHRPWHLALSLGPIKSTGVGGMA